MARAEGEGWHLPPQRDARPDGVTDPAGVAWLRRTFTAHPRRTMQQPVRRAAPRCAGGVGPAPHLPPSWRAPRRGGASSVAWARAEGAGRARAGRRPRRDGHRPAGPHRRPAGPGCDALTGAWRAGLRPERGREPGHSGRTSGRRGANAKRQSRAPPSSSPSGARCPRNGACPQPVTRPGAARRGGRDAAATARACRVDVALTRFCDTLDLRPAA